MADPVSWLMIEPGWKVRDPNGNEIGRVEEVIGDAKVDIFDGLSVATGILGRSRYVAAEAVVEIVEGTVTLTIDKAALAARPAYEPAR